MSTSLNGSAPSSHERNARPDNGAAVDDAVHPTDLSAIADIGGFCPTMLLERAKTEYDQLGRRLNALGSRLSMGPSWNMLLDLFISGSASRRLSVTALCIGARTSPATALRYLSILQDAGLVERTLDASDARRSYVCLTPIGWQTMQALLEP